MVSVTPSWWPVLSCRSVAAFQMSTEGDATEVNRNEIPEVSAATRRKGQRFAMRSSGVRSEGLVISARPVVDLVQFSPDSIRHRSKYRLRANDAKREREDEPNFRELEPFHDSAAGYKHCDKSRRRRGRRSVGLRRDSLSRWITVIVCISRGAKLRQVEGLRRMGVTNRSKATSLPQVLNFNRGPEAHEPIDATLHEIRVLA